MQKSLVFSPSFSFLFILSQTFWDPKLLASVWVIGERLLPSFHLCSLEKDVVQGCRRTAHETICYHLSIAKDQLKSGLVKFTHKHAEFSRWQFQHWHTETLNFRRPEGAKFHIQPQTEFWSNQWLCKLFDRPGTITPSLRSGSSKGHWLCQGLGAKSKRQQHGQEAGQGPLPCPPWSPRLQAEGQKCGCRPHMRPQTQNALGCVTRGKSKSQE